MKRLDRRAILALIFAALAVPVPTTIVPEWQVTVTDGNGRIVPNAEVRQTYYPGFGGEETETLRSDESGSVTFPVRRLWFPISLRIAFRMIGGVSNLVMPHGSEDRSGAMVWSPNSSSDRWLKYEDGGSLDHRLIQRAHD